MQLVWDKGHFERCCNCKQEDRFGENAKSRQFDKRSHNGKRVQRVDYYEEDGKSEEDMMVLKVGGDEVGSTALYYMEDTVNGNHVKTMIDTGSSVTIVAVDE